MMQRAFTLVEILVVTSILALLAAIAVPSFDRITARANSAKCLSNLKQIGVALNGYLAEHNNEMPTLLAGRRAKGDTGPVIDEVLADYLDDPAVFLCPADPSIGKDTGTSYFWNSFLNGQRVGSLSFLELVDSASRIPIISDKEAWHKYRDQKVNFLYADGHASQNLELFTLD